MSPHLRPRFRSLYTLPLQYNRAFQFRRAFHDAKAEFITFDAKGSLKTRNLDIIIGEPHQAYIMFDKEVGFAMKSAITKQTGICLTSDPEKIPLTFFHETLHFAHAMVPYPRVTIERDLPRQNATNMSPATLWLWGASHCITLDGTTDHKFEESARESYERLKGAAELLRDR
ncbi:hypothetical protein J3458_000871 [Metarhizium acridum]|uniref:Uncharacterized protein n=1 Tax=Metarhizium acridum (strain CQMa 102) TaxID=655827 RepID=E9DV99_METAQ|nr:uncharacterized protein MAC_01547 [Metarhizium acridum CQMa 102]EFY92276.1 hypothetical protein MAC_01547 [Metarhizium acridum CQMa 102]KAG8424035.1 hypothetical protein J3458_000871 [Metarhizium acridum]